MKKILFAIAATVLLTSCGGNKKQEVVDDKLPEQSSEVIQPEVDNEHNAQNSLDYQGVYKGVLPTADGPGREVTVELKDSTYIRTSVFLKGGEKTVNEGKYVWDDKGFTITLEGADLSNMYFVGEGVLITLDKDGNKIEGELAEHYKLTKE